MDSLLDKLLQVFTSDIQQKRDDKEKQLLTYLAQKQCLFIFDELSLQRRYLLTRIKDEEIFFSLSPIF